MPQSLRIRWFLPLPDGTELKFPITVHVVGLGPQTARFALLGERPHVRAAASHPPSSGRRGHRALHVLAIAERTRKLFEKYLGRLDWPRYQQLGLVPHHGRVRPTLSGHEYAFYSATQSSGRVRFLRSTSGDVSRSHDVCVHEFTHALLDNHKGWYPRSLSTRIERETRIVTEAVSDVMAMLSAAKLQSVRRSISNSRELHEPNVLSRFGEAHLGFVIRDVTTPIPFSMTMLQGGVEGVYRGAASLSSALYDALRRLAVARSRGMAWDRAIGTAVEDVAFAVFHAIPMLPMQNVRIKMFSEAVSRAARPHARAAIRSAFFQLGLLPSQPSAAPAVRGGSSLARGELTPVLQQRLEERLGAILVEPRLRPRYDRSFSAPYRGATLEFRLSAGDRGGALTVNGAGAGVSLYVA